MEGVKEFRKFVRKIFYEHDISVLNLDINTTQTTILMIIDSCRVKSMSEISKEVGLEKSSFTRSIDHLEEIGLIERIKSRKDRRIINISITEKGQEAVKLIKEDWNSYFDSLLSVFTEEEKEEFSNAVRIVSIYINRIIKGDKD